jgi:hypothetical protein
MYCFGTVLGNAKASLKTGGRIRVTRITEIGTTKLQCLFVGWAIIPAGGFLMQKRLPHVLAAWFFAGLLAVASAAPVAAQDKPDAMPKVGDMAPDFKLKYFDGNDLKDVSLSQYRGKKNVVVGFFIFAFTGG